MTNRPLALFLAILAITISSPAWTAPPSKFSLEDRRKIEDVLANYSYTFDAKDLDGFLALFTRDCLWEVHASGSEKPMARATNRDELRALTTQRLATLHKKGVQTRHYQTNTVLVVRTDGLIEGTTMLNLVWQVPGEKPFTATTGIYRDVFVKAEGGWRISKRALYMDQAELNK
jgi:uncharacterized protein (TIGR02246 family)